MTLFGEPHDGEATVRFIGGCPEGCRSFDVDATGDAERLDVVEEQVRALYGETCQDCGTPIAYIRWDEPTETEP